MTNLLQKLLLRLGKKDTATIPKPAFYANLQHAEPAPIAPSGKPAMRTVKVKSGDTLFSLAQRFNTTVQAIVQINRLANMQAQIQIGQRLLIPIPSSLPAAPLEEPAMYHVKQNDTPATVARRFSVPTEAINAENNLRPTDNLLPGQWLIVPPAPKAARITSPPAPPIGDTPPKSPLPKAAPLKEPTNPPRAPVAVLPNSPPQPIIEPASIPSPHPPDTITLPAHSVIGVHLSQHALNNPRIRAELMALFKNTAFNALVIEFKSEVGYLSAPVPAGIAADTGANRLPVRILPDFLAELRANHVHCVAQIAVGKDKLLAKTDPQATICTAAQQAGWVDPASELVWAYNIAVATEAARLGFNEVLFDHLRFSPPELVSYPQGHGLNAAMRTNAISGFLSAARGTLLPLGIETGITIAAIAGGRHDDALIGQTIKQLAPYADTLYPPVSLAAEPNVVSRMASKPGMGNQCQIRPMVTATGDISVQTVNRWAAKIIAAGADGFILFQPESRYPAEGYSLKGAAD